MFSKFSVQRGQRLLFVSHHPIVTLDLQLVLGIVFVREIAGQVVDNADADDNRSILGLSVYMYSSKSWRR